MESGPNFSSEIESADEEGRFKIHSASGQTTERTISLPEDIKSPSDRMREISEKDWKDICEEAKRQTEKLMENFNVSLSSKERTQQYDEIINMFIRDLVIDRFPKLKGKKPPTSN